MTSTFMQALDMVTECAFSEIEGGFIISNYDFSVAMGRIGTHVLPKVSIKTTAIRVEGENTYFVGTPTLRLKALLSTICSADDIISFNDDNVLNTIFLFDSCFVSIEEVTEIR